MSLKPSSSPGFAQERVPGQHRRQRRLFLLPEASVRDGEAERRGEVLPSQLLQVRLLRHNAAPVVLRVRRGRR